MSTNIYNKFQSSKYINLYFKIINNPNPYNKTLVEKHHILPKSIFPEYKNEKWNIVALSLSQHFEVHELLYKHYKSTQNEKYERKMHNALWRMANTQYKTNITSEEYAKLRAIRIENMSGVNNHNYGKVQSADSNKKRSEKLKGRIITDDWRNKISEKLKGKNAGINNPMYGKNHSDEIKNKISIAQTGIAKPQKLVTCPHCDKSGGNIMRKWHFDNCKLRKINYEKE